MTADAQVQTFSTAPGPRLKLPAVVTPTVALFGITLTTGAVATWLVLTARIPAWVTIPVHTAAMFGLFVVLHESAHHAAGRLTWINEVLGRLAMPFVSAVGAFPSARYLHVEQHRRDTGEHLSPWNVRGPAWQLPFRWLATDLWHVYAYLRQTHERPQYEVAEVLAMLVLLPGTLAAVVATGNGGELFVVYLLPQRLALALVAWWSDWHPRRLPAGARSYHRVHSRHPGLPFHRYLPAWRADREAVPAEPAAPESLGEFHPLTVADVRRLTDNAVMVAFTVPAELRAGFRFTPGQHVELRAVVDGAELRRTYAICSCPSQAELGMVIKQVPGGRFSTYATTVLQPGDRLDVRPPAGRFTLTADPRDAKYFVAMAAGVGIAPLLPMLTHALAIAPRCRATLLYINRSGADTLFSAELTECTRRFESRLRVLHFRTDERDPDLRAARPARPFDTIGEALAISDERYHAGGLDTRRLGALLEYRLHPAKVDEWFVSAPPEIAEPVLATLTEHYVPAGAIHVEHFTRSGE